MRRELAFRSPIGVLPVALLTIALPGPESGAQHHGGGCDPDAPPGPILSVADVTGDGVVDARDVVAVARRNPSRDGGPGYHPLYDRDADGRISGRDVSLTARDQHRPVPLRDRQLAGVALATLPYYGPGGLDRAIAEGFRPFTPEFRGHGLHYARWDRVYSDFRIDEPVGLNFSGDGRLLAVFYALPVPRLGDTIPEVLLPDPTVGPPHPSFDGLTPDDWHRHEFVWWTGLGLLPPADPLDPPVTFEQDLEIPEILARLIGPDGRPVPLFPDSDELYSARFWMIHAWVHELNPCGVFANIHPHVSPDAPDEHGGTGGHH